MQGRLAGKVAVITGAAQGIGAAYARRLSAEGAAIVVADIADTTPVVNEILAANRKAIGVRVDVCSADSVNRMIQSAVDAFGRVDILVNNAGLFANLSFKPIAEIDHAEWNRVMAVNVRGVFDCCKAVSPVMRKQGYGKIVNIASAIVFKGSPLLAHYVASKGAVVALTRALARELGEDGIRVNALAPGLTGSENLLRNPSWAGSLTANNVASRAIKREALPEDMAGTLVYLCAEESDFVTGQIIVVDGGSIMH
jgi:NAD(P)-dependent dehydrogenase (short-subunit alcohol dehydrogenase family)